MPSVGFSHENMCYLEAGSRDHKNISSFKYNLSSLHHFNDRLHAYMENAVPITIYNYTNQRNNK